MRRLIQQGVIVKGGTQAAIRGERPQANPIIYKDITKVVKADRQAGLTGRVVPLKPLGVIKG